MVLLNGIHSECFVFGFQSISETTSSMLHFTVQVSELHLKWSFVMSISFPQIPEAPYDIPKVNACTSRI